MITTLCVYTDATGDVFATRDWEGGTEWAVPDADGKIVWVHRKTALASTGDPVMELLDKVYTWE